MGKMTDENNQIISQISRNTKGVSFISLEPSPETWTKECDDNNDTREVVRSDHTDKYSHWLVVMVIAKDSGR